MLEKLRKRLQQHTPQRLDHIALPEAAVLMPIVERPAPTLLFTRRASHLTTHRGQVNIFVIVSIIICAATT